MAFKDSQEGFLTPRRIVLFFLSPVSFFFVVVFTLKGIQIHDIFGTAAYDMGLMDQSLWLSSRFEPIFNTVRGIHAHGDHFRPIEYLYVPLYNIYPSIYWALLLQSLSVGAAAIVLFYVAREFMPDECLVPAVFSLCFLLNPVVHNTLLWQYHDIVLAYVLFLLLILFYLQDDIKKYVFMLIMVLCCREDMPFITIGMGVIAIIHRRWQFASWTIILSMVWWMMTAMVIMPFLNDQGYFRHESGTLQVVYAHIWDLDYYIERFVTSKDGRLYLWYVFYPLLGLSFIKPLYLLPAAAALAVNILIGGYNTQIGYHYSVNVMPFVFLAAVAGYAKLKNAIPSGKAKSIVSGCMIVLLISVHVQAFSDLSALKIIDFNAAFRHWQELSNARLEVRELKARIGNKGIAATDFILPHFSQRKHIYLFPNPWKIHYWGIAGENPHHPNYVNYIIMYKNEYVKHVRLLNYLLKEGFFEQTGESDRFLVFKRIRQENASRELAVQAMKNYMPDGILAFDQVEISQAFPTEIAQFDVLHLDALNPVEDSNVIWKKIVSTPGTGLDINFNDYFSNSDLKSIYVACELYAQEACEALIFIGSDDGLTLWVNGEKKLENFVLRSANPGDDMVNVNLEKGENSVLFRVNNASGAWRLVASIEPLRSQGRP